MLFVFAAATGPACTACCCCIVWLLRPGIPSLPAALLLSQLNQHLCCLQLQVLLLSARDALLSRLVLSGRTDPANTQRFCRIAFGAYNPKPRGRNPPQNPNALPGAGGRGIEELRAAAAGLLEGSGVPELEERVLGFLCEAAAGVKLMATLDDMGRLLAEVRWCFARGADSCLEVSIWMSSLQYLLQGRNGPPSEVSSQSLPDKPGEDLRSDCGTPHPCLLPAQVSNVSSSCRAALAASSQSLADKTATLQTQLDETLSHFDSIMEGTAELQVEVTDEVSFAGAAFALQHLAVPSCLLCYAHEAFSISAAARVMFSCCTVLQLQLRAQLGNSRTCVVERTYTAPQVKPTDIQFNSSLCCACCRPPCSCAHTWATCAPAFSSTSTTHWTQKPCATTRQQQQTMQLLLLLLAHVALRAEGTTTEATAAATAATDAATAVTAAAAMAAAAAAVSSKASSSHSPAAVAALFSAALLLLLEGSALLMCSLGACQGLTLTAAAVVQAAAAAPGAAMRVAAVCQCSQAVVAAVAAAGGGCVSGS